ETLKSEFTAIYAAQPEIVVRAPGRVNLIGEHTDYNDGFVLPVAIDKCIAIAARKRDGQTVILHSLDFNSTVEFTLDAIQRSSGVEMWSNYIKGVAYLLQEAGYKLSPCEAVITGDIPIAAGLSSSAALEVASALMFLTLSDIEMDKTEVALLCQRAENQFVGVNCGIMDQFISVMGQRDHALFLDCRSLDFDLVPLHLKDIAPVLESEFGIRNDDVKIIVCNTKVKRELAGSEYNKRRAECERGVDILKRFLPDITALRDVSIEDFNKYADHRVLRANPQYLLPPVTRKRCRYVIAENARVLASIEALRAGNLARFGDLMRASHAGLRDEYEVSSPELDAMVEIALSVDGVIGARMTGAGFGGCTVNLVYESAIEKFIQAVELQYPQRMNIQPEIYVCNVEDGATVER
ncbi:MAG: galactokinase, partial [Candidatus Poribacteria bacterium]